MTRGGGKNREQIEMTSLDDLVPEEHLVRKLENAIDWSFIYEMVEDSYCEDNGRPSLDPVILIKLPTIQYMFGIRSMRQTIQEIKVNTAYGGFWDWACMILCRISAPLGRIICGVSRILICLSAYSKRF